MNKRTPCKKCGLLTENPTQQGGHNLFCGRILTWEETGFTRKRIILLEESKGFCSVCDEDTWMGKPIPLEIDHIDGDSDNDSRENLRVICLNCHGQTSTYRGKNRGHRGSKRKAIFDRHFKKKFGSVPQ